MVSANRQVGVVSMVVVVQAYVTIWPHSQVVIYRCSVTRGPIVPRHAVRPLVPSVQSPIVARVMHVPVAAFVTGMSCLPPPYLHRWFVRVIGWLALYIYYYSQYCDIGVTNVCLAIIPNGGPCTANADCING